MSTAPFTPPRRAARWQLFFLLLGLVLLAVLIGRVGARPLLAQAAGIGWYFAAIVLLFGGVHLLRALSWRLCLNEHGRDLAFRPLLGFWIAGEAVSHLSFAWSGEAVRVVSTREAFSVARGLSAQLVSRALYTYASLCWVAVGFLLVWWTLRLEGVLRSFMFVGTLASTAVLLLATAALVSPGRMVAPFARALARLQSRHSLLERLLNFLRLLESDLAALAGRDRRRLLSLLGLNLLAALAGVVEVYLVLRGLGATPALSAAFVIESLAKLLGLFAFLVPGNVGVREGGTMLILQVLSLPAVTGLNLALIRRARALVWAAVGTLLLIRHGLSPLALATPNDPAGREDPLAARVTQEQLPAAKSIK